MASPDQASSEPLRATYLAGLPCAACHTRDRDKPCRSVAYSGAGAAVYLRQGEQTVPRYFSLPEARALLPRVRPILQELQALKRRLDEQQRAAAQLYWKVRSNGHDLEQQARAVRAATAGLLEQIRAGAARLEAMGVELKDLDIGLVDFRARRRGREVYLCYRVDEDDIRYWHELDAGYAGRRPLTPEDEQELG
jgi:hypothetical protein